MLTVPNLFLKPKRVVEPEILDSLPADHPAAIRSRRDLVLINFLMGNQRWIIRQLAHLSNTNSRSHNWELGSGDGTLGSAIHRQFNSSYNNLSITGLDLAPRPLLWPPTWLWQQTDLLKLADLSPPADLVIANLILHHFNDLQLQRIGQWLSTAQTIIAVEPHRAPLPHALAYAMRLLGINYVTREDIHTSINAGFSAHELPALLGLHPDHWIIKVTTTPLGAYQMHAQRRS